MKELNELAKDIAIVAHPDTRDLVEKRAFLVLTNTVEAVIEFIKSKSEKVPPKDHVPLPNGDPELTYTLHLWYASDEMLEAVSSHFLKLKKNSLDESKESTTH